MSNDQKLIVACSKSNYDNVVRMINLGAINFTEAMIATISKINTIIGLRSQYTINLPKFIS